jgi:hypothetical protein
VSEHVPARRVVLHVGLHKTGTTYLQNLMRQNRRGLARRCGVYVPPGVRKIRFASLDLIPFDSALGRDVRVAGAWDRLAAEINGCGLPTAVVSEERLDVANQRQARRAVSSFPQAEVDVVVTVRDLARVAVSHWQEDVKNGATWTLDEFIGRLQDPDAAGTTPARGFWLHEDVTGVLRTWASAVPVERIHVVTVPPAGSAPDILTGRFGSVVGFTPEDVPLPPAWNNENVGAVGTELIRRLNTNLDGKIERSLYKRGVSGPVTRRLAQMPDRGFPTLDDAQRDWASATSARFADEILRGGYRVVGDLSDLRPAGRPTPDEPAGEPAAGAGLRADAQPFDDALLQASLEALSELATRYSEVVARADRETAARRTNLAGPVSRLRTHVRSRLFAVVRSLADTAGRSSLGRRVGAAYLRRRAGR